MKNGVCIAASFMISIIGDTGPIVEHISAVPNANFKDKISLLLTSSTVLAFGVVTFGQAGDILYMWNMGKFLSSEA